MNKIISYINLPKKMSHHLFGEDHTNLHRKLSGAVVMIIGVAFVTLMHTFESVFIHLISDIVGYALHGIGLIPYIASLEKT